MDAMNIVKIFIDNGLDMNLGQAADVARQINNTVDYEAGQKAGEAYKSGYSLGVTEGRMQKSNELRDAGLTLGRGELIKLRGMEDFVTNMIAEAVPGIIESQGRNYKIKCIKALRERFPFLNIKDAKKYIDAGLKKIIEDETAAIREASQRAYAYSSYDYDDSYDYGCGPNCSICG